MRRGLGVGRLCYTVWSARLDRARHVPATPAGGSVSAPASHWPGAPAAALRWLAAGAARRPRGRGPAHLMVARVRRRGLSVVEPSWTRSTCVPDGTGSVTRGAAASILRAYGTAGRSRQRRAATGLTGSRRRSSASKGSRPASGWWHWGARRGPVVPPLGGAAAVAQAFGFPSRRAEVSAIPRPGGYPQGLTLSTGDLSPGIPASRSRRLVP